MNSVAFRFIAANDHPDHDTIATFRRRFLKDIEKLFVEVLQLAREMGVLKMGTIGLDGTKWSLVTMAWNLKRMFTLAPAY